MLTRPVPRSARAPRRVRSTPRAQSPREVLESPPAFDRDYWLRHCEGFKVEAADGAIGFVDEVSSPADRQPLLHVRAGLFGKRVLVVPAGNVAFIVPRAEKLWLASPVQIIDSGCAGS